MSRRAMLDITLKESTIILVNVYLSGVEELAFSQTSAAYVKR